MSSSLKVSNGGFQEIFQISHLHEPNPSQCLRTVFVVFLPTQNRVGKALKSADEVKKPTGFQITLLDCICFEVLFSAVIILHVLDHTNKALEESLKKSPGLHEIQINL